MVPEASCPEEKEETSPASLRWSLIGARRQRHVATKPEAQPRSPTEIMSENPPSTIAMDSSQKNARGRRQKFRCMITQYTSTGGMVYYPHGSVRRFSLSSRIYLIFHTSTGGGVSYCVDCDSEGGRVTVSSWLVFHGGLRRELTG